MSSPLNPSPVGGPEAAAETAAPAPHHEASFQRDLGLVTDGIARMAELADRALRDAITALHRRDRQLAYAVIIRDQAIDALEKENARHCLGFLVRQQPAGAPLRFIYTAIKINSDLERIGDYSESIAHQATKLAALPADLPLARFQEMADLVLPMLRDAVRAFLTQNAALAQATIPMEDTVDLLKSRLRRDLVQMYKDNQLPFEALDPCLTIARRLERVSDQARDICAETLYLCTGEFAQHPDADKFRVLFLDQHNAGAGLMAEAIAESLRAPGFLFGSAGLEPQPTPPAVLEFMRAKGLELAQKCPKALNEVPQLDRYHIVAVLHPEAKKLFPRQARKIIFLDWPVEDPATVSGPPEAVRAVCERTFQTLDQHLRALVQAVAGQTS